MYAIDVTVHISKYQTEIKDKALVAYDKGTGKIYAIGQDAEKYESMEGIIVATPFMLGKITDYNIAVAFFKYILNKAYEEIGVKPILKKNIGICIGRDFNEIERNAWIDCLRQSAKPKEVSIYDKSYKKTLELFPLFSDAPVPEVIFEIGPVDLNELIRGKIDEIYNIAKEREIPMEDVTKGISDYLKMVEFENTVQ